MAYLVDTNVFITAKNVHYGFDFCPAFWDWMKDACIRNRVVIIDKVLEEILAGKNNGLKEWIKEIDQPFEMLIDAQAKFVFEQT